MKVLDTGEAGPAPLMSDRYASTLNVGTTSFVLVVTAVLFSTPLRHGDRLLSYAQDDLYYYLTVARHLVRGAGSTFDGTTPTNGYHPLYMLFLLAVTKISSSLRAIYRGLWLLDVASAMTTFVAVRALFARRLDNPWLTNGFAMGIVYLCCWRLFQQMEVTLTLPLGFLLLLAVDRSPRQLTNWRWAAIGLLATAFTLSRLDAGLLVLLCTIAALLQSEFRATLTVGKLASFTGTYLPLLLVYFWVNEHFFHRLTPISGAAKQASTAHTFYLDALLRSFSSEAELMFLLALLALCSLPFFWSRLNPELRVVCVSGLLFPFVHWGINAFLSDWMLWPWYRYSLIFAMSIVLLLAGITLARWASPHMQMLTGAVVFVAALASLSSARYKPDWMMADVAVTAGDIQTFAASHPGRYAMGDRAGMVGYTDGQPTVQTEGLMMDDAFLNRIRRSEPLRQMLRDYHVDYYIGFDWTKPKNWPAKGCFQAKEPYQAGPSSPAMRGEFCQAPVAEYKTPSGRTLIFDLRAEQPKSEVGRPNPQSGPVLPLLLPPGNHPEVRALQP